MLGAILGLGYLVLLSRFVEGVGKGSESQDGASGARFALVILCVILVGRIETLFLPAAVAGVFTYQLASLRQGISS